MGLLRRLKFHALLKEILGSDFVYFQPNETTEIKFPCILYSRDNAYRAAADNIGYRHEQRYVVTLINRDPDNPILDTVLELPHTSYSRGYASDGLNHDVISIYY